MKELNKENILENVQHNNILRVLNAYADGLTLLELTYLLTKKEIKKNLRVLQKKFSPHYPQEKESRQSLFKTRQRIYECIKTLRRLELVKKEGKKYILDDILRREVCYHAMNLDRKIDLQVMTDVEHEEAFRDEVKKISEDEIGDYVEGYLIKLVSLSYSDRLKEVRNELKEWEEQRKKRIN